MTGLRDASRRQGRARRSLSGYGSGAGQAIRATAILGTPVGDSELSVVENVLSEKSVDIRQEIASLMQAGSVPASLLTRLGL